MAPSFRSFFPHSVPNGSCTESSLHIFLTLMDKHNIKDLNELEALLTKDSCEQRIMAGPLRRPETPTKQGKRKRDNLKRV